MPFFRSSAEKKDHEAEEGAPVEAPVEEPEEEDVGPSTSPLLQTLMTRFMLLLPGVRDLPREFWSVRVQGLLARLGEAELSESYDKGALGTRKVLATAMSGLVEMVGRGAFGGVKKTSLEEATDSELQSEDNYDHTKAEDLVRAWDDVVEELIYGNLVDDIYGYLSKTDDLEGHSPAVKAAAEYAVIQYVSLSRPIPAHSNRKQPRHFSPSHLRSIPRRPIPPQAHRECTQPHPLQDGQANVAGR